MLGDFNPYFSGTEELPVAGDITPGSSAGSSDLFPDHVGLRGSSGSSFSERPVAEPSGERWRIWSSMGGGGGASRRRLRRKAKRSQTRAARMRPPAALPMEIPITAVCEGTVSRGEAPFES